ncbi:hypothetical protein HDU90_008551 [Geranomyces variabilis]|nr:hypothetical protein HDU90_008551 [Geranomyces variabilis]
MPVDHLSLPNTMSLSQPRRPPDHPLHDSSSTTGLLEHSQTRRQHCGDTHQPQQLLLSAHYQQPQQQQPPQTLLLPQQPTTQFISKIAQVVLRSRVRPPPAPLGFIDALVLAHHPEFWRNSVPVNIDIYLAASHTLLERWVVSYQPNPAAAASPSSGPPASPALSSDQKRKADLTDLILMVQALYSYIRLMPLHALLADGAPLDKADLHYYVSTADGCPLSPSSDAGTSDGVASDVDSVEFEMCASSPLSSSSSSSSLSAAAAAPDENSSPAIPLPPPPPAPTPIAFDLAAKLKVYKFRTASTASGGRLHLSVVYDASVAGMVPVSLSAAKANRSPTKALGPPLLPFGPISAGQRSGAETKAEGDPMDTDGGGFFERRRSSASLGSPFPSPTMQKRVLTFAHWKLAAAAVPSAPHNLDPAALPPLAPSSPPPALPPPPRVARGNAPLDLAIMIPDSDDGEDGGSANYSLRSIGIPYGEPMRYRSPGDGGFSSSSSLSTRGTRRPDLRIDIPPSPRFEDEMSEHQRDTHRRRSPAHHHHPSHHHHSHHHHQSHHHHHRHHHNSHHHHRHHHHSQADKAPSPTTTIRSIDIPLPAFTSGGFSSFSPSSGHHLLHTQRPPNGSYGSHSTTPADLFGALVGSYEESILSGRMSALPSKPLRFIAEIGAMAHGRCPPGLRCPPHLAVPFDAFFYEVGEEEAVTPYVGSVNVGEAAAQAERKAKEEAAAAAANTGVPATADGGDVTGMAATLAREGGDGRVSKGFDDTSSKCRDNEQPSRGYRIPPKGQLQIVIKNPSRTAIKLFLLPYDVRDLPPYGKTLLRQKSYASTASTTTQTPAGTSGTTSSTTLTGSTATPPAPRILRHAVHVPIHRTKKSLYLGPLVRVVFSSRGADEKERCSIVTEVVGGELNGGGGGGAETTSHSSRRRGSGVTPAR